MIEKAPDYAGKLEEQYVILGYDEHARNGETQECIELYQVFNGKLMHIVDHEEFGFGDEYMAISMTEELIGFLVREKVKSIVVPQDNMEDMRHQFFDINFMGDPVLPDGTDDQTAGGSYLKPLDLRDGFPEYGSYCWIGKDRDIIAKLKKIGIKIRWFDIVKNEFISEQNAR